MPGNAPCPPGRGCLTRPFHKLPPPGVDAMAALRGALWKPGTTLGIVFGDPLGNEAHAGSEADRAEVLAAAATLMKAANIKFAEYERVPDDLQAYPTIRCSFDFEGGSWSDVGRGLLALPRDQATMNIGWANDLARSIHELVHSMGYEHGHQSYFIPWNIPVVERKFGAPPNNWSPEEVHQQVIDRIDPALLLATAHDPDSIEEYPIEADEVTDLSFAHGWNEQLSAGDLLTFQRDYPF